MHNIMLFKSFAYRLSVAKKIESSKTFRGKFAASKSRVNKYLEAHSQSIVIVIQVRSSASTTVNAEIMKGTLAIVTEAPRVMTDK